MKVSGWWDFLFNLAFTSLFDTGEAGGGGAYIIWNPNNSKLLQLGKQTKFLFTFSFLPSSALSCSEVPLFYNLF